MPQAGFGTAIKAFKMRFMLKITADAICLLRPMIGKPLHTTLT